MEEVDVVVSVRELLQVVVFLPHQGNLFLQAVKQYISPGNSDLLVGFDHLANFNELPFYGAQDLGEDPFVFLQGCLGGMLLSYKKNAQKVIIIILYKR